MMIIGMLVLFMGSMMRKLSVSEMLMRIYSSCVFVGFMVIVLMSLMVVRSVRMLSICILGNEMELFVMIFLSLV